MSETRKFLDGNGLLYVWGKIKLLLTGKVDVVAGKQLSTNDFGDTEKTKLAGLYNYVHPITSGNKHIPSGGVPGQVLGYNADGEAKWVADNDTKYGPMTGATAGAAGVSGLVPAPPAGAQMTFLRGDGTFAVPTNTTYNPATQSVNGLMSAADKIKLDGFGAASTYALKSDIASAMRYKGSVATYAALPSTGNTQGDMYDVKSDGMNYAWTGTDWDALGSSFTVDALSNEEIDGIFEAIM